jgi:hypothetical protein
MQSVSSDLDESGSQQAWLQVLWRMERWVTFATAGSQVEVSELGAVAAWPERAPGTVGDARVSGWQAAVCDQPMTAGRHYAEFTVEELGVGMLLFGVVGSTFDATNDEENDDDNDGGFGNGSKESWMLSTSGVLFHASRRIAWGDFEAFTPLNPLMTPLEDGSVIGLELDLEQRTLAVWQDGERKGLRVWPMEEADERRSCISTVCELAH